jgi:hypothetical protein
VLKSIGVIVSRILRIQAEMQNSLEELVESDKANSSIFPELKEEAHDVAKSWFTEIRYMARRYEMQGALHSRTAPYWRKKLGEMPRDTETSSFEQITNWKKWLNLTDEQYVTFKERYYARLAERHPKSRWSRRKRELEQASQPATVESVEEIVV